MAEGNVSAASNGVENLTAQLRILKKELATLDPNSKRFQELANQAGDVKDRMNDAAEAMNANAGSAFEKLSGNASLLKDRLLNLDFEGVGSSIKSLAGNIRGISFKDITSGIGGMISALGSLGKAILMNPILLLAAVIIAVIMNFEKLKNIIPGLNEAMTGVSDEMTAALETSKKMSAEAQKQLDSTLASESSLKLQGMSEKEILQLKIAQTKERIKGLEAEIEAQKVINVAQFETAKKNKEILKGIIQFLTVPLQLLLYTIDEVGKTLGQDFGLQNLVNDWTANLIFDPQEVQNEGLKVIEEQEKTLEALKNSRDSYVLSVQAIDKAAADKRKSDKEKEDADKNKSDEAYFDYSRKELNKFLEEKNKSELDSLVTNIKTTEPVLKQWHATQLKLTKEQVEADKAMQQERFKSQLQMASDALGSLMALNDAFQNGSEKSAKRAFQINKALSLAQAIMNTYQAVNAQLAVPQSAITGTTYIKAGISLAAGLANVAKIAKTQFQSTSSGGGGGASGGGGGGSLGSGGGGGSMTSVTPSFNPLNTSFLNNRPSQTGAVQAYVLSSNVSSAMEANQKVKDQTVL